MYKSFSMELAGRTLTVDIGRVAKQANGAAFMHYGDTVVLSTATASEKPREGIDFFPLSVEYEEKLYSVGKIPGGFNKREGKASENAVLTSRVNGVKRSTVTYRTFIRIITSTRYRFRSSSPIREPNIRKMPAIKVESCFLIFRIGQHTAVLSCHAGITPV